MIKKDVFGAIAGVEGTDYFVTETKENGNRVCVTSLQRHSAPDPKVCCDRVNASSSNSYYGRACSNKVSKVVTIERPVTTSGSRYGIPVYQFEIDPMGFVLGEPKALTEKVEIGYCSTHDPERQVARAAKREADKRVKWQQEQNRDAARRAAANASERIQRNYPRLEKAAKAVLAIGLTGGPSELKTALIELDQAVANLARLEAIQKQQGYLLSTDTYSDIEPKA